ncbi:hypothetical protein BDN72DRAFT_880882 [Pluteus cervinus]|uniref:Uncharacterized protein n=1 Tax=Pluteus cervinus TaxID=181527 RepID=A0ACD3AJ55_9AGAR|nr:hypothetical protein BDN72DRAFT_880882 [Pluteus cervinus]
MSSTSTPVSVATSELESLDLPDYRPFEGFVHLTGGDLESGTSPSLGGQRKFCPDFSADNEPVDPESAYAASKRPGIVEKTKSQSGNNIAWGPSISGVGTSKKKDKQISIPSPRLAGQAPPALASMADNPEGTDEDKITIKLRSRLAFFTQTYQTSRAAVMDTTFLDFLDQFTDTLNQVHNSHVSRIDQHFEVQPPALHEIYLASRYEPISRILPSPHTLLVLDVYNENRYAPSVLDHALRHNVGLGQDIRALNGQISTLQARLRELETLRQTIFEPLAFRTMVDEALCMFVKPHLHTSYTSNRTGTAEGSDIRKHLLNVSNNERERLIAAIESATNSRYKLSHSTAVLLLSVKELDDARNAGNLAAHSNDADLVEAFIKRGKISALNRYRPELREILHKVYPRV